jgi:diguanylate cyclase (GGDEF)-like protein
MPAMHKRQKTIDNSETWLRSVLLLVSVIMALIIAIDALTLPPKSNPHFNTIRIIGQFLPILIALLITYIDNYQRFYQQALLIIALVFSLVTLYIIWSEWTYSKYSYAYEGLMINVYFFFFIARMGLKQAIIYSLVIMTLFLALILQYPIYGDRNIFNFVMLLVAHIMALVGVYRLHKIAQENSTYNQLLMDYSITDELTQIHNRKGYQTLAPELFSQCQEHQNFFSLIIFDLDYFKEYNDQFGHAAGDEVLKLQAQFLHDNFTHPDELICRFGGDEFVVISASSTQQAIQSKAQQVLDQWSEHKLPLMIEQQQQFLSCSIGIYSRIPTTQHTLHDYFIEADKALYQAKNTNKGSFKLLSN